MKISKVILVASFLMIQMAYSQPTEDLPPPGYTYIYDVDNHCHQVKIGAVPSLGDAINIANSEVENISASIAEESAAWTQANEETEGFVDWLARKLAGG